MDDDFPLKTKLAPPHDTATLDDAQAAAIQADDRIAVTVRLKPRYYEYLTLRAQMNNRETAHELEVILREFKAYYDQMRPDQAFAGPTEPGMPATTRRLRP